MCSWGPREAFLRTIYQIRDEHSAQLAQAVDKLCDESVADEAQVMSALVIALAGRLAAKAGDLSHAHEGIDQVSTDLKLLVDLAVVKNRV